MDEAFYQEIKKTIDTNLVFSDIEILDYHKEEETEILKIELPFTTTGNILTYRYNSKTDLLELINATIYVMKDNRSQEEAYIDKFTIMKIYDYCRNKNNINIHKKKTIMNKTKIEDLYKILIKGLPLTKETLSIYKFTEEEIKNLIDEEILKETKKDKYTLTSANDMYRYGIYLELNKQPKKAEDCFRRCYQIEPTNRKVCLQLMLLELKRKNYIAAQNFFKEVEQIEPEENLEDNKLYLFLLGIILFNNKEYQERLKDMGYDEILIPNTKQYKHKPKQNQIRLSLVKQKYPYALTLTNDLIRKDLTYTIEHELLKELILQALLVNKKFKSKIRTAALNKDYNHIVNLLESKSKKQFLGNMETYILLVTKSILEIIKTKEIPVINTYDTSYMYEAIQGNNFKLARILNLEFIQKINQNPDEDILNILLNDIIKRIEDLELEEAILQNKETTEQKTTITPIKKQSEDEELAYYIKEMNISFKEAIKAMGIRREQSAVIKLIYARDYFIEGKYEEANKLLQEVNDSDITTSKITDLLKEIKEIITSKNIKTNILVKTKESYNE